MNTEMNIIVNVSNEEANVLNRAAQIMSNIGCALHNLEKNGHYCYVDHVNFPESLTAALREAKRIQSLSHPGHEEEDIDLDFTRESYEKLVTDQYDSDELYGVGYDGAVCYEITFRDYKIIDVNFYLLGKNDGYGKKKGIPYSYEDGFIATIYDTYEETLNGLKRDIKKYISSHPDLAKGAKNTILTWGLFDSYSVWNRDGEIWLKGKDIVKLLQESNNTTVSQEFITYFTGDIDTDDND